MIIGLQCRLYINYPAGKSLFSGRRKIKCTIFCTFMTIKHNKIQDSFEMIFCEEQIANWKNSLASYISYSRQFRKKISLESFPIISEHQLANWKTLYLLHIFHIRDNSEIRFRWKVFR